MCGGIVYINVEGGCCLVRDGCVRIFLFVLSRRLYMFLSRYARLPGEGAGENIIPICVLSACDLILGFERLAGGG
jgi:hypothetical protein